MDPRNFLNEQSIWQFETLENKSEQTAAGVEKILNGTWMYNSVISYKDQNGKTIKMTTKYSDAIISAAKQSGLSAYYLASRIVQEVGGTSAKAGGASGTVNGYKGIYNYYNIGAGSSATDGLYWASLDITDNCTNTDSVKLRQGASTSTAIVATLARGTAVDILSSTDVQADGYVWHNVSVPSIKKSGYIRSDLLGDSYGRPWTNPSLSIINGAKYIADDFSDEQNTVYLQKFNVNPKSSATHSHEYMKNVAAPSAEANKIYKALSGADALSRKTTFIIPVFSNMPDLKLATPAAKITANSNGGFILSWNKIINADKYEVYYDNGTGYKVFKTVTGTSLTIGTTTYGKKYQFKVRAVKNSNSSVTSAFSNAVTATNTKKLQTPTAKITANSNGGFKLTWNKITGADKYQVYYDNGTGYKAFKTVTGTSLTISPTAYGKKYQFKVRAVKNNKSAVTSAFSNAVTATNTKKLQTPGGAKATVNKNGSFTISWNKVTGADKYQVYIYDTKTKKYKLYKTTTANKVTTGVAAKGKTYQYKIRALKSSKSSITSAFTGAVKGKR